MIVYCVFYTDLMTLEEYEEEITKFFGIYSSLEKASDAVEKQKKKILDLWPDTWEISDYIMERISSGFIIKEIKVDSEPQDIIKDAAGETIYNRIVSLSYKEDKK